MIKNVTEGHVAVERNTLEQVLNEYAAKGIRTFEVNGEDYSPETLKELVDMAEAELKKPAVGEEFVIAADCTEPWVWEEVKRLAPYAEKEGFLLIAGQS